MKQRHLIRDSILAWFASNAVAANLLMVLIFIGGILSLQTIDKQAYPRFAPTEIEITADFPGATPPQIETGVCIPIEEAIHDLPGQKRLKSAANAGQCKLSVVVEQDYDLKTLSTDIRARIQAIKNLPKAVERITIDDMGWEYPAISVVLSGDTDRMTLHRLAAQAQDALSKLEGVRLTQYWNKKDLEMTIEIPAAKLREHQLSLAKVADAIHQSSLDVPGGLLKADTGEFQLHTVNTAYNPKTLWGVPLKTLPDGSLLTLADVADIKPNFAETEFELQSNGKPSETIGVYAEHDLVETAQAVTDYVAALQADMPEGISVTTRRDNARSFVELLDTLMFEGISGFVLVLVVLLLFLNSQVALWAAVGIMISVFGALWLMPIAGVTLNMLSLFGFVLAMGVLVDDAIIVSERIYELQTQGYRGISGAIRGVRDVAVPVILGVSIGLIAFLPGLFVPPSWALGFMKPVAVVMLLSLAFSLVEALLILPAHLAHDEHGSWWRWFASSQKIKDHTPKSSWLETLRQSLNRGLSWSLHSLYQPLLQQLINWRYATVAGFAGAVVLGWALVHAG